MAIDLDAAADALERAGTVEDDINSAVMRLRAALPGWWFTIGRCDLTCHSTVGPDRAFIEQPFLDRYDRGFSADIPNPTTCAAAIDAAVALALEVLAKDDQWQARTPPRAEEK